MKITQDIQAKILNGELLLLERNLAEKESEIIVLTSINTKLNSTVDGLNSTVDGLNFTVDDLNFTVDDLNFTVEN